MAGIRIGALGLLAMASSCHPAKAPVPKPTASARADDRVAALKPYPVMDWSQEDLSHLRDASEFAETRAICASVIDAEPPTADLPTAAEQAALKGCDSHALYYGIGMPAEPAKARHCAMIERTVKRDAPFAFFEAEGMLAMVYANGRGAARNYDVAIHMACRIRDAAAAIDFRIKALAEHRRAGWQGDDFDTCDDNTSGVGSAVCADHEAQLAEQSRAKRIARLERGWTPEQRRLFDRVYASLGAYADTTHQMDCHGGTGHAACTIRGREADIERFLARVEALAAAMPLPRDEPSGGPHPAIAGSDFAQWHADSDESGREWLASNRAAAIAARRVFERDLIAFSSAALPRFTPHQVRVIFANI